LTVEACQRGLINDESVRPIDVVIPRARWNPQTRCWEVVLEDGQPYGSLCASDPSREVAEERAGELVVELMMAELLRGVVTGGSG
jgi:hypothetical protein